jgi:hypothetical protein
MRLRSKKIKADIDQFSKMQKFFLGTKEKVIVPSVDIRGYAKYFLKKGFNENMRELLGCLKSKISLAQKNITMKKHDKRGLL